jgi:hypothetical protein
MNTITLPKNIHLKEISAKWCENHDERALTYTPDVLRICEDGMNYMDRYGFVFYTPHDDGCKQDIIAEFFPDRKIFINDEEKFQPLLNYIEERSNV